MSPAGRLLLATLALLTFTPFPAVAAELPDFAAVDEAARDAVASGEIPGVVVLVGQGDDILYHRAFGSRSLVPTVTPMLPDTVFDVASLTKPVGTTLAVMSLVERGAVTLDAPLGRYLREFRLASLDRVTIRRLLTHSAGLVAIPPSTVFARGWPSAARRIAKLPLDYPPGTAFQYSDTGFILLAEMVRRVSGLPLDRYLDRLLIRPLGLTETTFHPSERLRARIAPTEFHDGHMLLGEVHDPRARQLDGVAGHAGLFSTAADLAKICQMLLHGGALNGRRVLRPETVQLMWSRDADGRGTRALGWDMTSGYALVMAPFFPAASVGHTGYTGTSIWIDPSSRTYLIVLTNRVHPWGGNASRIRELRVRMAAAVGAQLFRPPLVAASVDTPAATDTPGAEPSPPVGGQRVPVKTGLDGLVEQDFALLRGHTIGLVTNQTGIDARGRRAIDLIAAAPGVKLHAIFSPEHGITGLVDADVPNSRDVATGVRIWSLYGPTRRPDAEMLHGITMLVFDVQDVGTRSYTYLATLRYVLEEAGRHGIPVVVLDRPNPITGRVVEGPLLDSDLTSFTGPHEIPVRTGMTIGEYARMIVAERKIPVALTIVALGGWERSRWFDQTGLPWVNPSPNIRSLTEALLYSGLGLLEATNLSVGRGTPMPFEVVGAPWIEPRGVIESVARHRLAGVRFEPTWFTPAADKYANVGCAGVRIVVTDREAIRPVSVAIAIATALRERHRDQWRPESIQNLLVNRATMWAFLRGEPFDRLLAWTEMERSSFLNRRASYLIYR